MERFSLEDECRYYKAKNPPDIQRQFDEENEFFPAYDTDYLLEKLEPWMSRVLITRSDDGLQWVVSDMDTDIETYASAFRDAMAGYAIKLFKEGKLKREGK